MSDSGLDLSGDWIGIYNYPAHFPPNQFQARISDRGGTISGATSEEDQESPGTILTALIEGRRDGAELSFAKVYDDIERMPDVVHYRGTIDPGGDEISGRWEVPGIWSGTFLMIRNGGAVESIERTTDETIDVD